MMNIKRFVIGTFIAMTIVGVGGMIADHFELARTTCIFLGGVFYAGFDSLIDRLNAAPETKP